MRSAFTMPYMGSAHQVHDYYLNLAFCHSRIFRFKGGYFPTLHAVSAEPIPGSLPKAVVYQDSINFLNLF